uniref:Biotin carboxyl carrier protein of acetyl-CoA carboxylase n=1 Tax=Spyridia filamentosa TaxID=196632 RepID=A0A1Z1MK26_SPYFI|nr:acetyl-CoA carboxylase biotin carboxyl carrier protein [Spyridia filamentosa]ARW66239.1 acetyl-CoA carboxylase biotin carboxyl carrier protein [Spyridia filamentosa]
MTFKIKDLRKILYSVNNNCVNHISIKSNKFELIINKLKISYIKNEQNKNPELIKSKIRKQKISNNTKEKINHNSVKIIKKELETYSTIISPMVGTFYRSPAPNEAPFIEKDDTVKIKQTVCIIEAMKLMNEIESEVNGKIVEILVNDGDIVDCGQALMKIQAN